MTKDNDVQHELSAALKKQKKQLFSTPVKPTEIKTDTSIADLVESMSGMSIQARNIGLCGEVLKGMLTDPARPTVLLGLAGPLIAAGLRHAIRDLIASGAVDVVVSTGAVLYQDIYQARGFRHYQGEIDADDGAL